MAQPHTEKYDLVDALTKEIKNDKTGLKIENDNFNNKDKSNDMEVLGHL